MSGQLGFTPQQTGQMTFREIFNAIDGYNDKQKQEWERTRWQTWHLINIQLQRKDKIKLTAIPLPWDDKTKPTRADRAAQLSTMLRAGMIDKQEFKRLMNNG